MGLSNKDNGLPMLSITALWDSDDSSCWEEALARYWRFVQPKNEQLERNLDALDIERIRAMGPDAWYVFLRDEYFPWKYTAPNRLATTRASLERHNSAQGLIELDRIRRQLLALDPNNIRSAIGTARGIHGLGTAGASGLLALVYPQWFGTVDQFAVKALRLVRNLPEAHAISRMKELSLTSADGATLIQVMRRKAAEVNTRLSVADWTPRKVDKVLWTYGR